jgi:hypothetical protein
VRRRRRGAVDDNEKPWTRSHTNLYVATSFRSPAACSRKCLRAQNVCRKCLPRDKLGDRLMCFASGVSVDHLIAFGRDFVSSSLNEPILLLLSSRMRGVTKQTWQTPKSSQYLLSCGRTSLTFTARFSASHFSFLHLRLPYPDSDGSKPCFLHTKSSPFVPFNWLNTANKVPRRV